MALLGCGKHQAAQTSPPAPPADSVVAVDSSAQNPAIPAGVPGDPPPEVRARGQNCRHPLRRSRGATAQNPSIGSHQ